MKKAPTSENSETGFISGLVKWISFIARASARRGRRNVEVWKWDGMSVLGASLSISKTTFGVKFEHRLMLNVESLEGGLSTWVIYCA